MMHSVGQVLKEARFRKKYSLNKLENVTRIKREFIDAIEKSEWFRLPEFPVVRGFVRSLAGALDVEPEQTAALLRRDYPPKELSINPKPDVSKKFIWSPKFTFFLASGVLVVTFLSYLGYQYYKFLRPPVLMVDTPYQDELIKSSEVKVAGRTDIDAAVKVNNQQAFIDANGNFETEIRLVKGENEIVVKATSRASKETTLSRKIKAEY